MLPANLIVSFFPAITLATPALYSRVFQQLNWTVEYATLCKSCPYSLCTNVNVPDGGDNATLTCWTNGETVGDDRLWLHTTDNCYLAEYDMIEYPGDFREDLKYCGAVPLEITKQPATVQYLSECKWTPSTSAESIEYYGRDLDVTLTCWANGDDEVLEDPYWYKTTDNCHISETGLYDKPDRGSLDFCGPNGYPRINESDKRTTLVSSVSPVSLVRAERNEAPQPLSRRWLQAEQIGEEYSHCHSCASRNTTCPTKKVYEFNQTVISQCYKEVDTTYENGTISTTFWMLTTDWCWVDGDDFWIPPWDFYRYPSCTNWGY